VELLDARILEAQIYEMGDMNLLFMESTKAGLQVMFKAGIQEDLCQVCNHKAVLYNFNIAWCCCRPDCPR
jgi:hypothetical protein